MFGSLKSQRTSLFPLFGLLDRVAQVKQSVDDTLDMSGAVVTPEGHPDVGPDPGWGEDYVQAIFRPLLSSPDAPLEQEEDVELDPSGIEALDQQVIEHIQQKAREKAVLNREHAYKALNTYDGLFPQMYPALADFANGTSDSDWIFLCLYSVTDFNQRRPAKQKMATIFMPNLRQALTSYTVDSFQGIFGGEEQVTKTLENSKKQNTLIKGSLLATKKAGKAGTKSGNNKGKKTAAGGVKAKGKKGAKKKAGAKPKAKANSDDSKGKEQSSFKEQDKDVPCKSISFNNLTSCHPSNPESCKCGTSMDYTVASIPWDADWPVSFLLQSVTKYVSTMGLHLETIVSRLSKKLGGRIAYSEDSYRTIGAIVKHIDIIWKGYKPSWDKLAPRQRVAPSNPTISLKASNVLDTEVTGLLYKGAIREVGPVQGQYVSSYFAVPKSKRSPEKWRPILNLKKFNEYVCQIYFKMEDIKTDRKWFQKGSKCVGLNLKDAFLHVPMSACVKKFLRFKWKGKL